MAEAEWQDTELGFQKQVLRAGDGPSPQQGEVIELRYRIKTKDMAVVAENWADDNNVHEFRFGKFEGVKGVNTAVTTMKRGEHALFRFPPQLGFSDSGRPEAVGADDELYCEIELVNSFVREETKFDYTEAERPARAEALKREGNELLAAGDLAAAARKYEQAFDMVEWDVSPATRPIKVSIRNNQCLVLLKQSDWAGLVRMAEQAVELDGNNVKALLRGGRALRELQDFAQAEHKLRHGLTIVPGDAELQRELALVLRQSAELRRKEARLYAGVLQGGLYAEHVSPQLENPDDPVAFFSVQIGERSPQRVAFKLFAKIAPKTVKNFLALCDPKGADAEGPLTYLNSAFHRLIKGFMVQGGDFDKGDGTGGRSIYGRNFADEGFVAKHAKRGLLSMANAGPNTNGSQFFILFAPAPHLDGKHVVFGRVCENEELLDELEAQQTTKGDRPIESIRVIDCGVVTPEAARN